MKVRRGTATINRTHAKNYIGDQAQKRFDEVVKPYQDQGLNALKVDSIPVLLYQAFKSTVICTCKQTVVQPEHSNVSFSLPPNVINPLSQTDQEIVIDYSRPLFGNKPEATTSDDYTDALDFALDDEEQGVDPAVENLFSTSTSHCGICYGTGFQPGYTLIGQVREVLTTLNVADLYGYHIDQTATPHTFNQVDGPNCYVDFELSIPKYFVTARYSIRNSARPLSDEILYLPNNTALTLAAVTAAKGNTLLVRVRAEMFTHVQVEFDLGIPLLKANVAQQSKVLDWTNFDTLGNLNVVLPNTISEMHSTDLLVLPTRNQVLTVTDTPYMRTAHDNNLEWSVTTRVVQPQEPTKLVYSHKVLR